MPKGSQYSETSTNKKAELKSFEFLEMLTACLIYIVDEVSVQVRNVQELIRLRS